MDINEQCVKCKEPTKYVAGFWDAEKSSGAIWACKSTTCGIAIENARISAECDRKMEEIKQRNLAKGFDVDLMIEKRK